jgi:hypothetical protein
MRFFCWRQAEQLVRSTAAASNGGLSPTSEEQRDRQDAPGMSIRLTLVSGTYRDEAVGGV